MREKKRKTLNFNAVRRRCHVVTLTLMLEDLSKQKPHTHALQKCHFVTQIAVNRSSEVLRSCLRQIESSVKRYLITNLIRSLTHTQININSSIFRQFSSHELSYLRNLLDSN